MALGPVTVRDLGGTFAKPKAQLQTCSAWQNTSGKLYPSMLLLETKGKHYLAPARDHHQETLQVFNKHEHEAEPCFHGSFTFNTFCGMSNTFLKTQFSYYMWKKHPES